MAPPHPTSQPGLLRIPAPGARQVEIRLAPLTDRDVFDQAAWQRKSLTPAPAHADWWEVDVDALGLPDGTYEYEFVLDGKVVVADPYAEALTRFNGYRGTFEVVGNRRIRPSFRWNNELPAGVTLPQNNQIVIYEMPLRWMTSASDSNEHRQMGVGTFDQVIFERLQLLKDLGINAIELLPVQDSPDTLNWGYGTRFFFAPDFDMGTPVDLKFFVKRCHQLGIRVLLDVVMNHSSDWCPLVTLAPDWYYLANDGDEGDRNGWGGRLFRYRTSATGNYFAAREFHCEMAEFLIEEFHIDGFRLDEFKSINHWEFVQMFRERAWQKHLALFPGRPFLVIAEDTNRRFETTRNDANHPNGRRIVDALWNFSFQDEGRNLITDQIHTRYGSQSRTDRIQALLTGGSIWDEYYQGFREGYGDMAQAVNYFTSHDVEAVPRLMNTLLDPMLRFRWLGSGTVENIRTLLDNLSSQSDPVKAAHAEALERVRSAFALLLTAVGIPMFLAGEEFGDVHDLNYGDHRLKMSDPVDWKRQGYPGHKTLWHQVSELIRLRTSQAALHRNELQFFYFHPAMDQDGGERVFAYCRTAGLGLGATGQVIVVANGGPQHYPRFVLPWHWSGPALREVGIPLGGMAPQLLTGRSQVQLSLAPFQVRVFVS